MRFLFLLLLFPLFSVAQFDTTKFYRSPNYGDLFRRAKINQLMIPSDTTTNKVGVAQIGQRLFLYNVNKWVEVGNFDSTSLSNRINLKINISDTAAMLNAYKHWIIGYLKGTDTVALSNRINLKLNISDTASMLLTYRHWLQGYLKGNDTVSLSNRKLNISDTASMLNSYKHWLSGYTKNTDTLAMLNGRLSSITLNTSGSIHTTPTTFTRVGGSWSGTLNLATQSANTIFAAPNGSSGVPSFRSLVSNDIPNLSWSKITSGLPTTLAGYGITNGAATNTVNTFTTRNNFTSLSVNKDSIPISFGRLSYLVIDTTTGQIVRQIIRPFTNGGNAFAGLATFGTTDNNDISIITNNTDAMRITTTGNVGVGTTPSGISSYRTLHLEGSSGSGIRLTTTGGVRNGAVYIDGSGLNLASTTNDPIRFLPNNSVSLVLTTSGNALIGTLTDNPRAILNLTSLTKGVLIPRMTQTQRNAIAVVAGDAGLQIYCTDCAATDASTGVTQTWNGTTWKNHW